jgi:hypothetical protein
MIDMKTRIIQRSEYLHGRRKRNRDFSSPSRRLIPPGVRSVIEALMDENAFRPIQLNVDEVTSTDSLCARNGRRVCHYEYPTHDDSHRKEVL